MMAGTGFYGKLPAIGDFVQRGLPAAFVERWDRWLQESMLAARATLGPAWLEHYQSAPVWRFLLAPGCIDEHSWIGLMIPSIDRVGRCFPLTLALAHPGALDLVATLEGAARWFAALEQVARGALGPELDLAAFEAQLAGLGAPPLAPLAGGDATMPLRAGSAAAPLARRVDQRADYASVAAAVAALRRPACVLAGGAPLTVLALELLPAPAQAVALLDARWGAHGWRFEDDDATRALASTAATDHTRPLSPRVG
jgi:type VI secretion system protein ImpM